MKLIDFAINQSTPQDIEHHLKVVQHLFVPPLQQRVDLGEYSKKLFHFASRFEAWHGNRVVGLVAAYTDTRNRTFFVTNVSVDPDLSKRGIASTLLRQCLEKFAHDGITSGSLEVHDDNAAAVEIYRRLGFRKVGARDGILQMKRCVESDFRSTP